MMILALVAVLLLAAQANATPASHSGCVYATGSKILRSIFVPDTEEELNNIPRQAFESFVTVSKSPPASEAVCRAAIQAATGVMPPDDRTAVVNAGAVIAVIRADPAVDSIPGASLIPSMIAIIGDQWNGTNFLRRYAVINPLTKTVTQIIMLNPANPINPVPGSGLVASPTLAVGNVLSLAVTP